MRRFYATTALVSLLLTTATSAPAADTYRLRVDGLACPFCAYGIEKKLRNAEGVERVDIHINDGVVLVTVADGADFDEARVRELVNDAGFTLRDFEEIAATQ